jgi:6-phosphogluconate dehydrogenase
VVGRHLERSRRQCGHPHRPPSHPQHLHAAQLTADIRCGQVLEPVTEPQIDVMDLGLAPSPERKLLAALPVALMRPAPLEGPDRPAHIAHQVPGLTGCTRVDLGGTTLGTALVLFQSVQHAQMAVGVTGQMREHMAHGPPRQLRGSPRIQHLAFETIVEHREQALMSCCGAGHVSVQIAWVHDPTNVPQPWQPGGVQIAMVGLGKMGANMARRLMGAGHQCVVHDLEESTIAELETHGARGARSLAELVESMNVPRHVWIMVPAEHVGSTIDDLAPLLAPGDTIIDGGNSWYGHASTRYDQLGERGISFLDVGTSGGVHGAERGYCLMVGGEAARVHELSEVFDALAPGVEAAPRTPGRSGEPGTAERGWLHCGPAGAGHFAKMVHNGIEYGMMAAMAEGLNLLATPHPGSEGPHGHQFDLTELTEVWRRGSVVSSWLLDLTAQAMFADPELAGYSGWVEDSGEGRWTIQAAVERGVPAPVMSAALFARFSSRGRSDLADRAISAMRAGFGGHLEPPQAPA